MTRHPSPQSGVALIVTIIMLSVITFLTVAFLALSGREKGSVKVMTAQTTAQLGADYAIERAKVDLLTGILATRNPQVFDLLVSTNYINYAYGFQSGAGAADPTNVSYTYLNGNPLSQADLLQNLANQLYDPRPPVFITNRLAANSTEFRYYLDLNRNGQHDRSGLWPETNQLGLNIIGTNSLILSNRFVGDPEWIGIPARPGQPHSASNQYVARYAFVVVPEGKTLDVNYLHNQAATRTVGVLDSDGFLRNQGVGGWELNLAAFLADLNTNIWNNNPNPAAPTYQYNQVNPGSGIGPTGFGNVGLAFDDARSILNYRYANNYNNLSNGHPAFMTNLVDEYSDGSWMTFPFSLPLENDVTRPWAGSDNPNHFFSLQDLFSKVPGGFSARLISASSNLSTYDQYTYYRLLAQLGTASAPEDSGKLNLNYANVAGYSVTNYVPWTEVTGNAAEFFFTNAVDRLLRRYSEEWLASDRTVYTNLFRMERAFGVTNIPVMVSNQFVYSPAIHRLLQVAANIWDTKPNARKALGLPTVFRPQFEERDGNVYINNFVEEILAGGVSVNTGGRPYDPLNPQLHGYTNVADLVQANGPDMLLYGVPLVVGAHKGLPNFNEFQFETLFSLTRKVQLRKSGGAIDQTNQYFTVELQMPSAVEFWNSYATNFNRQVSIYVTNVTSMTMTNDLGVNFTTTYITGDRILNTNNWRAFNAFKNGGDDKSHVVMMRTNVPFLPERVYLPDRGPLGFFSITNDTLFDTSQNLLMPRWGVVISNRVHAMIVDNQDRIIDYVVLGNLTFATNLTDMVSLGPTEGDNSFRRAWQVNLLAGNLLTGRPGIIEQINISLGAAGDSSEWKSYSKTTPNDVTAAIQNFRNFFYNANTNGYATVPYTPTKQFRVPMIWQANDPLVHYLADDLLDLKLSGVPEPIEPPRPLLSAKLAGIGTKNGRYQPWPQDTSAEAEAMDISIKDARVRASDDWQFPTNALPTVGWLGRVHRGTPWQTVYMKAGNVGLTNIVFSPSEWAVNFEAAATRWANWSGNRTLQGGYYTRPTADRLLFDVFTTAVNDNSARGRLNINQTNLAAWSAVFSGVAALTNVSNTQPIYNPYVIEPAGIYEAQKPTTWPPLVRMVNGINAMRANTNYFRNGSFQSLGDILAVPELTDESPFLNRASDIGRVRALTDVAYEWLPQQVMSLLHLEEATRFSIFAYGQALQPAPDSILVGGAFSGLCTNYAITAEVAARAVLRVEGSPEPGHADYPPKVVVESFNYLPPE